MSEVPTQLNAIETSDFPAIGLPRDMVDVNAIAQRMGFPFKPATEAQMNETLIALRKLNSSTHQPPLRRQVQSAKPATSKGSTKMPAAAPVKTEPKKSAPPQQKPAIESLARQPQFPMTKTRLSTELLQDIAMSLFAAAGKQVGCSAHKAESHCKRRRLALPQAIATSGVPQSGGYLGPEVVSPAIRLRQSQIGHLRLLGSGYPMTSGTLSVPAELGGLEVEYPGEASSIAPDASQLDIGAINFHARNRVIRTLTSRELYDDAAVSWADLLIDRFAHAFSRREDLEMVAGDGSAAYGGVSGLLANVEAARTYTPGNGTGKSVWSGLALSDHTAAMAKLPEVYATGRRSWVMSTEYYFGVALPSVSGNNQGFAPDGRPMYLGFPVNIIAGMPTATAVSTVSALFGDFSEAVAYGDRGIRWAFSDKSPNAFDKDLIEAVAVSRIDIVVANPDAYVALKTAAS